MADERVLMTIPISKGKNLTIDIDINALADDLPPDVYREVIYQGMKQVLNRGFTKETSAKAVPEREVEATNAALLKVAEKNLEAMKAGEIRITGGKAKTKGVERAVMTEAMRISKAIIKDGIKKEGKVKVSHVAAKVITALAKEYLEGDNGGAIVEMARANLKEREQKESAIKLDLSKVVADPKLVAASKTKKEGVKKPQPAGVVAKAKPQASHATH